MKLKRYRILYISILVTIPIIAGKYVLHQFGGEIIELGSLHSSVVTGTFFVIGFLLSATISDYKESERIPPEFASTLENMYEDARTIHANYPAFDFEKFEKHLQQVASSFASDIRTRNHRARLRIHQLNESFESMEQAGVPANFIVKHKTQQATLVKHLFRVNYIQRITFIPSATILARTIIPLTILMLVLTDIQPFVGGLAIVSIISLILIYILQLLQVISTPFHDKGKTQDDVSLFLIDQTVEHLKDRK